MPEQPGKPIDEAIPRTGLARQAGPQNCRVDLGRGGPRGRGGTQVGGGGGGRMFACRIGHGRPLVDLNTHRERSASASGSQHSKREEARLPWAGAGIGYAGP